jgi:formylglycine-generating enzyme
VGAPQSPPSADVGAAAASSVVPAIAPPAAGDAPAAADAMEAHAATTEALLALVPWREGKTPPQSFLEKTFGVGTPARLNQGNREIAAHAISKQRCLEGLRGVTLQTEEQRARCGGAENMVPIWRGKPGTAVKTCIDIFEFPNRACELPIVWAAPTQAAAICAQQGKRLCGQEEWVLACGGDPEGGDGSTYAYGGALDLEACNTTKVHRTVSGVTCDPDSARSAWTTCPTDTEPAGSFPRCRSRFGVFDQHGNVAEIMSRLDADGEVYSQLKGSAFFYKEVAREPKSSGPRQKETYPDHCGHDPRWHVEPIQSAWHVNYHLGFRCCKTVR